MRTWRRIVIAVVVVATALLFYRWWQSASSRAERRPHERLDEPESESVPAPAGQPPAAHPSTGGLPKLDRAKADQMREQIRALLAEAGPVLPGAAPSEAPPALPRPSFATMPVIPDLDGGGTKVDPDYLKKRIHEDLFPLAKQCYQTALEKKPKLAGKLAVYFRIIGDRKVGGVVDEVKIMGDTTLDDPEMQTCVKESMMSVSFDAPPDDGKLSVVIPITFSPDEPDSG
jgi:hypothetical protein